MPNFPRRVLLIALGTTPALLTVTLAAIRKELPDEMPTEIHVVTTGRGAECARAAFLVPGAGILGRFYRDYGLNAAEFGDDHIHVIAGRDGREIGDIRTNEESALAADFITELVRRFCSDPKSSLHVSIVGGRKSMGLLLGAAMTFYGRDQDRISHVLSLDETHSDTHPYPTPEELEENPGAVSLGEIPFLRLRPILPAPLLDERHRFSEIVAASEERITNPPKASLFRDRAGRLCLKAEGVAVKPEKRALGLYAWLLLRAKLGRPTPVSFGGIALEDFLLERLQFVQVLEEFLSPKSAESAWKQYVGVTRDRGRAILRRLSSRAGLGKDRWCREFLGALTEDERKSETRVAGSFQSKLSSLRNRFNSRLEEDLSGAVPDVTHRRAEPYRIASSGQKDDCVYGIALSPGSIDLPDDLLALLSPASGSASRHWKGA